MAARRRSNRKESWASNPNLAVYVFFVLFAAWLLFQIWSRFPGGPPPPQGLDPMVMAALGVAISAKSVERKQQETESKAEQVKQGEEQAKQGKKIKALEEVAKESHPEIVAEHTSPLEDGGENADKH